MAIIEFVDRVIEKDEEVVEDTTDDTVEVEAEKVEAKAE
jgi:hypothetical protein